MASLKNNYQFQLLENLTTSGTSVTISNDLERDQAVSFTNAYIVAKSVSRTGQITKIERMQGTATGGVLTLSKRGLDETDVDVEVPALKKSWNAGTIVYVTILSSQVVDKQGYTVFASSGGVIFDGYAYFNGTARFNGNLRVPVYADATARDLAIPSPENGMIIYNTAEGTTQQYLSGAWTNQGSPTIPNASETVAGKVERATQAEANAGTATGGSGAFLFVDPSRLPGTVADLIENNSTVQDALTQEVGSTQQVNVTLGESVTAGDGQGACFFGEGLVDTKLLEQTTGSTDQNIGDIDANTRFGFSFTMPIASDRANTIRTLEVYLKKTGTPTDDLQINLFASDKTTPIAGFTQQTIGGGSLTTSYVLTEIDMQDIELTPWTEYFLEFKRSTANDGSNYFQIQRHNADVLAGFGTSTYTSSTATWSDSANDLKFLFQFGQTFDTNKVWLSDTRYASTAKADCVVIQSGAADAVVSAVFSGFLTQTSVTPWEDYWLIEWTSASDFWAFWTTPDDDFKFLVGIGDETTKISLKISESNYTLAWNEDALDFTADDPFDWLTVSRTSNGTSNSDEVVLDYRAYVWFWVQLTSDSWGDNARVTVQRLNGSTRQNVYFALYNNWNEFEAFTTHLLLNPGRYRLQAIVSESGSSSASATISHGIGGTGDVRCDTFYKINKLP